MSIKILTVDDAKAVRLLVERSLAPFACEVNEASNGFNAFFAIERVRPDLILLDVSMPVMDGVETLRRLKGAPELAAIPVLMLISPPDRPLVPQLAAMGATAILPKPFTETTLLEAVRRLVPLSSTKG